MHVHFSHVLLQSQGLYIYVLVHMYMQSVLCFIIYVHTNLGLGPKRAVSAIQNYKDIEGIIKHKDKIPGVRNYVKYCTCTYVCM